MQTRFLLSIGRDQKATGIRFSPFLLCYLALTLFFSCPLSAADEKKDSTVKPSPLAVLTKSQIPRPGRMVYDDLLKQSQEAFDRRKALYDTLQTPEQTASYQQRLREFFFKQLGDLPERTPLNGHVVGKLERDGYRVEKIIFESRPKHFVTGALYLPKSKGPYPGVIVPCGHHVLGKASEPYQRACILLAKNGIAAFCYDPIGQGERAQILADVKEEKEDPSKSEAAAAKAKHGPTEEHTLVGIGSILAGRNTASYRIWDGFRALDYLASRPEIDPERLGCTGNSGGGTLTAYLMALDPRILCAAPSCYITSFDKLLNTIGPQDAEQNIFGQIAFGMDHADYAMMRAPRPTLLCTATKDFFDIGGAWDAFREAKRFYGRLGHAERMELIETDAEHGFSKQLREGMVRWMRRWLLNIDAPVVEDDFPILTEMELRCTPRGQVMLRQDAVSVLRINRDYVASLAETRKERWGKSDLGATLEEVRRLAGVRRAAEIPFPEVVPGEVLFRDGYRIQKLLLKGEGKIVLPGLLFVPDAPAAKLPQEKNGPLRAEQLSPLEQLRRWKPAAAKESPPAVVLYVHGQGKETDAQPGGAIEKLVSAGEVVLAVDVRGFGETATGRKYPDENVGLSAEEMLQLAMKEKNRPPVSEVNDFFAAYLLGKSMVGLRAEDILACARFAAEHGDPGAPRGVKLVAAGGAIPPALHAAALERGLIVHLQLRGEIPSWEKMVTSPSAAADLSHIVHGALSVYDLSDLGRSLSLSEPEASATD